MLGPLTNWPKMEDFEPQLLTNHLDKIHVYQIVEPGRILQDQYFYH